MNYSVFIIYFFNFNLIIVLIVFFRMSVSLDNALQLYYRAVNKHDEIFLFYSF